MKKISLMALVVAGAMLLTNCKKEEKGSGTTTPTETGPAQKQNVVSIYFGGTWCPPCGAYGKPSKENLKISFEDNLTLLSCQGNGGGGATDPMNNADANSFISGFGISGFPTLYIGGANEVIQQVPLTTDMKVKAVEIGNTFKSKTAIAACDATFTLSGSDLTINSRTKFFADQTEEYYLGAYITESGLNYTQTNDASINKNIHDNILRKKVSTNTFGDLLSANNKNGDMKTKSFNVSLNSAWNIDKLYVSLILWRKNTDGKYTICNGYTKKIK